MGAEHQASTISAAHNYARMAKAIERTPFMRHLGMQFIEAGDGYTKLVMRYQDENTTAGKALHGGAVSSLIEHYGDAGPISSSMSRPTRQSRSLKPWIWSSGEERSCWPVPKGRTLSRTF